MIMGFKSAAMEKIIDLLQSVIKAVKMTFLRNSTLDCATTETYCIHLGSLKKSSF
jgi:hypothetical protein